MKTSNIALIETLDSDDYDIEGMMQDNLCGNFNPDNISDYLHTNIILQSLYNGQFTQAKRQCVSNGFSYKEMRRIAGLNPTEE